MLALSRRLIIVSVTIFAAAPAWSAGAARSLEEGTIQAIRAAAADRTQEGARHPLPLAASWNDGTVVTGFGPAYQIAQIQGGRYLLPWFTLSVPPVTPTDGYPAATDALYYEPAVQYLARNHLPLSFETTQWETLLPRVSAEYTKTDPNGHSAPLSPLGPIDPWYQVGREWARHGTLRRLQRLYPDPPLVLFVSNNEYPKLSPDELRAGYSSSADAGAIARRRAIGDAWIARYKMLLRGFREGLESPAWRANAVFVGYDAFMSPAIGRWSGWPHYSLYVPGRSEPWPYAWDGASVSYYVHDWAPDSDFMVWSPQVEAMNYVAVLDEVRRAKPAFWFEISTWDGQQPGQPTDKRRFYTLRGQELTASRYGGMVQFGMWLLRPRVVREFRNPEDDRIRFGPYFEAILSAVARVHDDATLRTFWSTGRLLENPVGGHPYQEALPTELASRPRWFLLDSASNPPRPWELATPLKVFSLAMERGTKPHREWLVYAFSPLDEAADVEIALPGGPALRVRATCGGAFTVLEEGDTVGHEVG